MKINYNNLLKIAEGCSVIMANGNKLSVISSGITDDAVSVVVDFPFALSITDGVTLLGDGLDSYVLCCKRNEQIELCPASPNDVLAIMDSERITGRMLFDNPFMRSDFTGTIYAGEVRDYHTSNRGNSRGGIKYPRYIGNVSSKYKVGIELEAYCPEGLGFIKESNWISFERDSSLSSLTNGIEMVTCPIPVNLAIKEDFWLPFTTYLTNKGVRSYKARETGLHCHIGLDAFSENLEKRKEEIGRLCYLYQTIIPYDTKVAVFGRSTNTYCNELVLSTPKEIEKFREYLKPGAEKLIYNEKKGSSNTRYSELNLETNIPTIEFRRGKGSINAARIASIIAFCATMVEYAIKTSIAEISIDGYIQFVRKRLGNTHPLLSKICNEM